MLDFSRDISRLAFLFLAYTVIAGGFVTQVLPCQMKKILRYNMFMKHIIGIVLIFALIMHEGGWSFNKEVDDMARTNWSRGNVIDSLIYAFLLYLLFMISSKMKAKINFLVYTLLFVLYLINTHRNYLLDRKFIKQEINDLILIGEKLALGGILILSVFGIINYWKYKKFSEGKNFNTFKFFMGTPICRSFDE